jgi:hypothetical protein
MHKIKNFPSPAIKGWKKFYMLLYGLNSLAPIKAAIAATTRPTSRGLWPPAWSEKFLGSSLAPYAPNRLRA